MREIKFRGMYKGIMVYGNLIQGIAFNGEKITQIERSDANDFAQYDVDPKTVGQFTTVKDIDGIKIYKGDIISYTQHHFNTDMVLEKVKEVKWNKDRWNIYETNAGESNIKVIGNIYENPELIK